MDNNEHSMILVNNKRIEGSVMEIYAYLLWQIDIKHSPLATIKENLCAIWDIVEEHCFIERELLKGKEKSMITRFLKTIEWHKKIWPKIKDKDKMMGVFYNYLLAIEGLQPIFN